jgi:hypothetical protein
MIQSKIFTTFDHKLNVHTNKSYKTHFCDHINEIYTDKKMPVHSICEAMSRDNAMKKSGKKKQEAAKRASLMRQKPSA